MEADGHGVNGARYDRRYLRRIAPCVVSSGAIDYESAALETALGAIAGGIDVYFDNVGGPLLDAVLPARMPRVA